MAVQHPQQSKAFVSLERGLLQSKCHASKEATSVKYRVAMVGVSRVLDISKRITQNQHTDEAQGKTTMSADEDTRDSGAKTCNVAVS